jgi:hypothetical protein
MSANGYYYEGDTQCAHTIGQIVLLRLNDYVRHLSTCKSSGREAFKTKLRAGTTTDETEASWSAADSTLELKSLDMAADVP